MRVSLGGGGRRVIGSRPIHQERDDDQRPGYSDSALLRPARRGSSAARRDVRRNCPGEANQEQSATGDPRRLPQAARRRPRPLRAPARHAGGVAGRPVRARPARRLGALLERRRADRSGPGLDAWDRPQIVRRAGREGVGRRRRHRRPDHAELAGLLPRHCPGDGRVHLCRRRPAGLSDLSRQPPQDQRHPQRHVGHGRGQLPDHDLLGDPAVPDGRPDRQIPAHPRYPARERPRRSDRLSRRRPRQPAGEGGLRLHPVGAALRRSGDDAARRGERALARGGQPLCRRRPADPAAPGRLRARPGRLRPEPLVQHLAGAPSQCAGARILDRGGAQGGLCRRRRLSPRGQRPAARRPGPAAPGRAASARQTVSVRSFGVRYDAAKPGRRGIARSNSAAASRQRPSPTSVSSRR